MRTRAWGLAGLASAVHLLLATSALADGRNPGSLLVFPEFQSANGRAALLTITNTNRDVVHGAVRVEIVFINGTSATAPTCAESNFTIQLSANDTFTFVTNPSSTNATRGYAYAFAKNEAGAAIAFDWLIGDDVLFDGISNLDYAINPVAFRALPPQGSVTDLDDDGVRDLNGAEYEMAPDKILIPRFIGQSPTYQSEIVLLNLTGGAQFTATLDFLVYNDNEEVFSRNFSFRCWTKVPLTVIANTFGQTFLASFTSNDPAEIVGSTNVESGWLEIDGHVAYSTNTQILDPAFLAVLVEHTGTLGGAELSFEMGKQGNGDLLPLGPNGDSN